jgi:D-3-phosphoglycerate dehydrogenase
MRECLIIQPIHPAGHAVLARAGIRPVAASAADPATVLREVENVSAVITREAGLSGEAMAAAPLLRVVGLHGVGTDPIAVDVATERGIAVINAPHSNVRSVAEHAVGLAFVLAKSVLRADHSVRAGDRSFKYAARLRELHGAVFGVVGFGNIGRATADLARAVGMRVVGYSRGQPPEVLAAAGVEPRAGLADLLAVADFVSLHLRLNPTTRNIIGARELGLMRREAFLINTSRGALIDEEALVTALRDRAIAGAGLDVFAREPLPSDSPLVALDNVALSPHVGASTQQALERTAVLAAEQIVDVLAGRRPAHLVNPEVWPRVAAGAVVGGGG